MKAAVFDIDGTLIDSIDFWRNLGKNYLISQRYFLYERRV